MIDKRGSHVDRSRAVDVQSRTLHVFDDLGIADEVIESGRVLRGLAIYDGSRRLTRLTYQAEGTPYPFAVALPQSETEEILERHLEGLGGRVERGVELTMLEEGEKQVQVSLSTPNGSETDSVAFVVGCDGVASTVRDAGGIAYQAKGLARSFVTADASVHWLLPDDEQALFLSADNFLLAIPLPGERRVRLIADAVDGGHRPSDLASFSLLASERLGSDIELHSPGFVATYHVQRRLAERYISDRVILAGDAAHSFDPVGGHGMNQGIQDAYNLGWKLALTVRRLAGHELLDSYDSERRGVAKRFAREMDFEARLQIARQEVPREDKEMLLDFAVRSSSMRRGVLDAALPGIADYSGSPIVRELIAEGRVTSEGLGAGQHVPDVEVRGGSLREHVRGTKHILLLLSGDDRPVDRGLLDSADILDRAWSSVLRITLVVAREQDELAWNGTVLVDASGELHRQLGAGEPSAFLIRPDGYVGFRATPFERNALLRYAQQLFGRVPPAG